MRAFKLLCKNADVLVTNVRMAGTQRLGLVRLSSIVCLLPSLEVLELETECWVEPWFGRPIGFTAPCAFSCCLSDCKSRGDDNVMLRLIAADTLALIVV